MKSKDIFDKSALALRCYCCFVFLHQCFRFQPAASSLSVFFLPLSFSLITNPTHLLSDQFFTVDYFPRFPPNHQKALIFHLLYILIVYVLSLCAIATITYSTCHAFLGKPVKFFPALKSLIFFFFPLLSTAMVAHILLCVISLCFFLDDVLSSSGTIIEGGPLQSVITEAIRLGNRATFRFDQSLKLLQITVSGRSINIVPQTLFIYSSLYRPTPVAGSSIMISRFFDLVNDLDLRRHN